MDPTRRALLRSALAGAPLILGGDLALELFQALAADPSGRSVEFARIKGLSPEVTPNERFYRISKNLFDPKVKLSGWSLKVGGLVDRPLVLSLQELQRMPSRPEYVTLECISNEVGGDLIGNARWKGVPLRDVLARAGVKPQAKKVVFRAEDGYSTGIPLARALHPDTLLVYEMNGQPLPDDHGFPLRLIAPGLFGMKNPKWMTAIELVDKDYLGYWEARGWSDECLIKTTSRIDVPQHSVGAGATFIAGVALAGDRGIQGVEVSTDGGRTWQRVMTKPALSPYAWALWAFPWTPSPGTYTILVRATDGRGQLQNAIRRPPLPEGATGLHTVTARVLG